MSISTTQKERKLLLCKNVRAKFRPQNAKVFCYNITHKTPPGKHILEQQNLKID